MTSTEKFYSDMIAKGKEIYNYDDSLEGWTFHLLKGDHRLKQSGMEWNVIVYPESAPENWIELLRDVFMCLVCACPLCCGGSTGAADTHEKFYLNYR